MSQILKRSCNQKANTPLNTNSQFTHRVALQPHLQMFARCGAAAGLKPTGCLRWKQEEQVRQTTLRHCAG